MQPPPTPPHNAKLQSRQTLSRLATHRPMLAGAAGWVFGTAWALAWLLLARRLTRTHADNIVGGGPDQS